MKELKESKEVKRISLISVALASFLTPFIGASLNIALPPIGKDFNLNAVTLGWVANSFLLAAAIFLVPFGRLADIYGRKKVFALGVLTFSGASILAGVSNSATLIIASRTIQGLGGAMIAATTVAILTSVFRPGERGKAFGINVSAVYIGLTLGPFLGGILIQHLGWRSIFFFIALAGLLVSALVVLKLKTEWADAKGESFDYTGTVLFGLSLFMIMYGFSTLPGKIAIILLIFGGILIAIFIKHESKIENPVLNVSLFTGNKFFAFSNFAVFFLYSATFAIGFLLSFYLQYVKALSPQTTGLILLSQPLIMALFSPVTGKISDRANPVLIASSGSALVTLGLLSFSFVNGNSSILFIILSLITVGAGYALFSSPNTNALMSSVERKYIGMTSGTLATMRRLGQMTSIAIATLMFSMIIGKNKISAENISLFIKSIRFAFITFTILGIIATVLSLLRMKSMEAKNEFL
ncbi:MAG: MFS transporter [Candidatus Aminicenantes bacterium]|nr:MFS transporter [Candidatus Aminicenantes bacterium]